MIKEKTFPEWVKSLPGASTRTRTFSRSGGVVYYRNSMGQNEEAYDLSSIPNMVRCLATKMLVWERECERITDKDGNLAYVSRMGATMHKFVNARLPSGRQAMMLQEHTIKVGGGRASVACLGTSVLTCAMSGELCFEDNMYRWDDDLVSSDWINKSISELVIQQHNFRPDEFPIPKSTEYAGVELEVEADEDQQWQRPYIQSAKFFKENLSDILYLKRDGSLRNGYEIVTNPIEWEVIRDRLTPALDQIKSMGMRSYESGRCGLHVHLPRNSMTQLEIAKLVVLWSSDPAWITRICGRSGTQSQSSGGRNYCALINGARLMVNGGPDSVNHYAAINTMNPATVEFRSYRGTLNSDTFLGRIGLCFLVRSYIRHSDLKPSWEGFLKWIIKSPHERKRFPESWSLIANCVQKHKAFPEKLREEVASVAAKKSNPTQSRSRKK